MRLAVLGEVTVMMGGVQDLRRRVEGEGVVEEEEGG